MAGFLKMTQFKINIADNYKDLCEEVVTERYLVFLIKKLQNKRSLQ